jgi:hypothetical protein
MSRYNELRDIKGKSFVPKYPDIRIPFNPSDIISRYRALNSL